MFSDVIYCNPLEVKDLAARKDGRDDFVFLCRGQDELGIRRRLLKGLQEGIESGLAEHVDLIDDVDLVLSDLGRDAHLLHEVADVIHRVVGGGVQLVDVERGIVVESPAGLALVTGFHVLRGVEAVDGLGHDTGAGRLAHATRAAEQESLRQGVVLDGVFQRRGDGLLTNNRVEGRGAVFSGGYDEILHGIFLMNETTKIDIFFSDFSFVRIFSLSLLIIFESTC